MPDEPSPVITAAPLNVSFTQTVTVRYVYALSFPLFSKLLVTLNLRLLTYTRRSQNVL
jgi:hypothetical protein